MDENGIGLLRVMTAGLKGTDRNVSDSNGSCSKSARLTASTITGNTEIKIHLLFLDRILIINKRYCIAVNF